MDNTAKAAKVIDRHGFDPCREPECSAQDLADAGLLAPELPEPDVRDTIDWWTRLASVLLNEDGERISIIFDNHWVNAPSPGHVRELGLALLAAANYQESDAGD